jgi:hypothetical protein
MIMRFVPYLLLLVIALLMKTSGLLMVLADLLMLLIPVWYIWKRRTMQVFHVSGNLMIPVFLSIWSVNTGVFFSIHDYPGKDVARIGAFGFLIVALLAISLTKDLSKLNGMKKETLSLNVFLYTMLGMSLIIRL